MRKLLVLIALVTLAIASFGTASAAAAKPNTKAHFISKTSSSARYHFVAYKASGAFCSGCRIQCRIDSRAWSLCVSGGGQGYKTFRNLARGRHTVRARAVNGSGQKDPTPAVKTVTI